MKIKHFVTVLALIIAMLPASQAQAASISVTRNNVTLTEGGGPLQYQVILSESPSPSTVTVSIQTNGQCLIGYEGNNFAFNAQTVLEGSVIEYAVMANDDQNLESDQTCTVSYSTTSSVPALNGLSLTQTFPIVDNGDQAATEPGLFTTIIGPDSITEGTSNIYTFGIGPSTAPEDPLTISATTEDGQCQLVSGNSLVNYVEYTIPGGVQGAAIFSVQATNDPVVEGLHDCSVTHSLKTDDLVYMGFTIDSTVVSIIDDEAPFDSQAVDAEDLLGRKSFGLLDKNDANNDGIEDAKQPNVNTFINGVSGRRQTLIASSDENGCNAVSTPTTSPESDLVTQDDLRHFPHGLLDFRVVCGQKGASTTITYLLDNLYNSDGVELVKYSADSGYTKIEGAVFTTETLQNGEVTKIEYNISDGGELDEDGEVNGVIVDPVGIAVLSISPQKTYIENINDVVDEDSQPILLLIPPLLFTSFLVGFIIFKRRKGKNIEPEPDLPDTPEN